MASNNKLKPLKRKYTFTSGLILAMHNAGCRNAAAGMQKGRAPSGKAINSLALFDTLAAQQIRNIIKTTPEAAEV